MSTLILIGLVMLLAAAACLAGPPLISDDPVPAPRRHWEVFTPLILESSGAEHAFELPNLDVNFGARKHLQLTLETGLLWRRPARGRLRAGIRDTELQVKYRFLYSGRENHRLHVAFFPQFFFPTGDRRRGLGSGTVDYELPLVWLYELGEKARIYGDIRGGILNAAGSQNFFFAGLAFESEVSSRWTLTGELYGRTAEEKGGSGVVGFNLGFIYKLPGGSKQDPESGIDLLFSGGRAFSPGPDLKLFLGPRFTFR